MHQADRHPRQESKERVNKQGQQADRYHAGRQPAQRFAARQPADLQLSLMVAALSRPCIPAVNVSGKKEQLQQQAGVKLDLKEDDGEQRDVDQPESIVTDLLQARQPDTQQPGNRPHGLYPGEIVPPSADGYMY